MKPARSEPKTGSPFPVRNSTEESSPPQSPPRQAPNHPGSDAGTATAVKPRSATTKKPRQLPPYHVILLNDNDHTYEYVIEMLRVLFGHPAEMGFRLAEQVDRSGRAIVLTTHKEKAELKRDQIHAYGTDNAVATCRGSMSAIIQAAD